MCKYNSNNLRLLLAGMSEMAIWARSHFCDEELQQGEVEGEPQHLQLGTDGGRPREDREDPTEENDAQGRVCLSPRAIQICGRALGWRALKLGMKWHSSPGLEPMSSIFSIGPVEWILGVDCETWIKGTDSFVQDISSAQAVLIEWYVHDCVESPLSTAEKKKIVWTS